MLKMSNFIRALWTLLLISFSMLEGSPHTSDKHYELPSICYNKDGVLVPMRGSCSGFYICADGHAIASSCGDYLHFNVITGTCDDPERAACFQWQPMYSEEIYNDNVNNDDVTVDVVPDATQLPVPMQPIITETNLPLLPLQRPSQLPKPKEPAEVTADTLATDICLNKETGTLLPKPDSCSQYYVCIEHRAYRRSCPLMLHFNATRKLCQDPALAHCELIVELEHKPHEDLQPTPPNFDDTTEALAVATKGSYTAVQQEVDFDILCATSFDNMMLQHPEHCDRFIFCQKRKALVLLCPIGMEYSRARQRCEPHELAQCRITKA